MLPENALRKTMNNEIDVITFVGRSGKINASTGTKIKPPPAPIRVPKPPTRNPRAINLTDIGSIITGKFNTDCSWKICGEQNICCCIKAFFI
jgi:hypothetical protein